MTMQQIYSSNNLAEARLIQSVLQSHDIDVVLHNENTVGVAPHLGIAVGIQVVVSNDDAERATGLLAEYAAAAPAPTDD